MQVDLSRFSLAGKRALVTGASRGIGQAIAIGLAQAGATVAVSARTEAGLAETMTGLSGRGVAIAMDVAEVSSCHAGVGAAVKALEPFLAAHDAVLVAGNGVFAWGDDVEQALLRLELVEHLATIATQAQVWGGPQPLPPREGIKAPTGR